MKILFITYKGIDAPCPRYRAFWPAQGLQKAGQTTRVCLLDRCTRGDIDWADIVIFERVVNGLVYEQRGRERLALAQIGRI